MAENTPKLSILVVDDDETLRAALCEYLKRQGMKVTACHDGAEAILTLKTRPEPFDVVITDLIMPGAGGMDVLRESRNRSKDTQVIIITGYASLETAIDAMHQGAFDYVAKPFKLVEISLILAKIGERKLLVQENSALAERIQSLYSRLDLLKENRTRLEKFMMETTDKLDEQSRKIEDCLNLIQTFTHRIEPFFPTIKK
jgi:DNA-binding NtrC family response regulator